MYLYTREDAVVNRRQDIIFYQVQYVWYHSTMHDTTYIQVRVQISTG